jgi:hypothetical protein
VHLIRIAQNARVRTHTLPHIIAFCAYIHCSCPLFIKFTICFYLALYDRLAGFIVLVLITFDLLRKNSIDLTLAACMAPSHELRINNASNESSFVHIEAVQAITTLRLRTPTPDATPTIRGTTMKLEIPLDGRINDDQAGDTRRSTYLPRRSLSRRDSMKRREALLMGKEGSRRRQRWENS